MSVSIAGFWILCIIGVILIFGAIWDIIMELPERERKIRKFTTFLDSMWIEEMIGDEKKREAVIKRLRMKGAVEASVVMTMGMLLLLIAFGVI